MCDIIDFPKEILEIIVQQLCNMSQTSVVVLAHTNKLFYVISRKCAKDNKINRKISCSEIALEG